MEAELEEYEKIKTAADSAEWRIVVEELDKFLEVEKSAIPTTPLFFYYRLCSDKKSQLKGISKRLRIQNAILIANQGKQVKFSELSIDMLRMMSCLERESMSDKKENPHKYLLFKPSIQQLLLFMCTAFNELQDESSALLVYISASSVAGKVL